TYCAVLGYVSIAVGEFSVLLLPSPAVASRAVAIACLVGLAALQCAGVRISGRFQEATTIVKFLAFLALVGACFVHALATAGAAVASGTPPAAVSAGGIVIALQSVVITYGGWQSALYFTEEDPDPQRDLPRSMIGGVAAVVGIYLLVNLALLAVLP